MCALIILNTLWKRGVIILLSHVIARVLGTVAHCQSHHILQENQ
jgi:hypothetical protein